MREETIKIYSFDELSEEAKKRSIEYYRNNNTYDDVQFYYDEINASYKIFKNLLINPIAEFIDNFDYNYGDYNTLYDMRGIRLYKYLINNFAYVWTDKKVYVKLDKNSPLTYQYPNLIYTTSMKYVNKSKKYKMSQVFTKNNIDNCCLTGVCYDIDFFKPIIDFLKNPTDNINIIDLLDSINSVYSVISEDVSNYVYSIEYITEMFINNEYEFLENGKIYYK